MKQKCRKMEANRKCQTFFDFFRKKFWTFAKKWKRSKKTRRSNLIQKRSSKKIERKRKKFFGAMNELSKEKTGRQLLLRLRGGETAKKIYGARLFFLAAFKKRCYGVFAPEFQGELELGKQEASCFSTTAAETRLTPGVQHT